MDILFQELETLQIYHFHDFNYSWEIGNNKKNITKALHTTVMYNVLRNQRNCHYYYYTCTNKNNNDLSVIVVFSCMTVMPAASGLSAAERYVPTIVRVLESHTCMVVHWLSCCLLFQNG